MEKCDVERPQEPEADTGRSRIIRVICSPGEYRRLEAVKSYITRRHI